MNSFLNKRNLIIVIVSISFLTSLWIGQTIKPTFFVEKVSLDIIKDNEGLYYIYKDKPKRVEDIILINQSKLYNFDTHNDTSLQLNSEEIVKHTTSIGETQYWLYKLKKHFNFWSLLPAVVTLLLCWLTREPITSLLSGVIAGSLILGKYNLMQDVFVPSIMTKNVQTISPKKTPVDAIHVMRSKGFRHLPVIEKKKIIGILSMRDLYDYANTELQDSLKKHQEFMFGTGYGS